MDRPAYDTDFIEDKLLTCLDCGHDFTFTAGEARFYLAKGLTLYPKRCPECRRKRKLTINRNGNIDNGPVPNWRDCTTTRDLKDGR